MGVDVNDILEGMNRSNDPNTYAPRGLYNLKAETHRQRMPRPRLTNPTIPYQRVDINPTFNRTWQNRDAVYSHLDTRRLRNKDDGSFHSTPSVGAALINYVTARSARKKVLADKQRGIEALAYARSKGIPDAPGLKGGGGPLAPPPAPAWNTQAPVGSRQSPPPTLGYITNTTNPHYRPPVITNLGYIANTTNPHAWNVQPPSGAPQSPPRSVPSSVPYAGPGMSAPSSPQYAGPGSRIGGTASIGSPSYVGPGISTTPSTPTPTPTNYVGPGSSMWQGGPGLQTTPEPALPAPSAPTTPKRKITRKAKPTT